MKQHKTIRIRFARAHSPRRYVTALPHDGAESEPEAVEDSEVVGEARAVDAVLNLPLVRAEAADEEESETDAEVGEDDVHPDLECERIHEGEYARLLFVRLLDHDADAEAHVRFREVDHPLSYRGDGQRRYGEIRLL